MAASTCRTRSAPCGATSGSRNTGRPSHRFNICSIRRVIGTAGRVARSAGGRKAAGRAGQDDQSAGRPPKCLWVSAPRTQYRRATERCCPFPSGKRNRRHSRLNRTALSHATVNGGCGKPPPHWTPHHMMARAIRGLTPARCAVLRAPVLRWSPMRRRPARGAPPCGRRPVCIPMR